MQINRFGAVGLHGWLYYLEMDSRLQLSPEVRIEIQTGISPVKDQFKSFRHFIRKIKVNKSTVVSEMARGQSDYLYNVTSGASNNFHDQYNNFSYHLLLSGKLTIK